MGRFVERSIVKEGDSLGNINFFMTGEVPLPKKLIDDVEGLVYEPIGMLGGRRLYIRYDLGKWTEPFCVY